MRHYTPNFYSCKVNTSKLAMDDADAVYDRVEDDGSGPPTYRERSLDSAAVDPALCG